MSKRKRTQSVDSADHGGTRNDGQLLDGVAKALSCDASENVFTVGGTITSRNSGSANAGDPESVIIRWDSGPEHGCKVSFPIGEDPDSQLHFQKLLDDCQPATFGRGQKNILDQDYRKAGKMDAMDFCTNFSLAEYGILNTINQTLGQGGISGQNHNGIRAELYNLNVYSAPAGKFKSHVDTPRSEAQMGSLVVCLPYPHKGGALIVRHHGQQSRFDWSKSPDSVQWAAFFSDCEHEVLQVSQGHRVTLTYNLYWTKYGPSLMATHLGALNQPSLHFYKALEKLLGCPSFLPKGGLIGFSCTHGYPHTSRAAIDQINCSLKGLDMLVYQALKHLTGSAEVRAVLDAREYEEECRERDSYSSNGDSSNGSKSPDLATSPYLTGFLFAPPLHDDYEEEQKLDPATVMHSVSHDNGPYELEKAFPKEKVVWLNKEPQSFEELAVAFAAYGNQAAVEAYYSAAVIISQLPDYRIRKGWQGNNKKSKRVKGVE